MLDRILQFQSGRRKRLQMIEKFVQFQSGTWFRVELLENIAKNYGT